MSRRFARLLSVLACFFAIACHEAGDVKVASLTFKGNHAFKTRTLSRLLVTQASSKLPWARPHYFNRQTFEVDLKRVTGYYVDHGYPDARVTSMAIDFTPAKDAVHLAIEIDEGAPLLIEAVEISGLEPVPEGVRTTVSDAAVKTGAPRDRQLVAASRERMAFLLRDNGYARARVTTGERDGTQPHSVIVTFTAAPGPETHFGENVVVGTEHVHESVVLRSFSFKTGDLFRESAVLESQRRLSGLGIFDFAHIAPREVRESADSISAPDATDHTNGLNSSAATLTLPMVATVVEGKPQRLQIGLGYGSEDGPRGSLSWEHLNVFGGAQQLSLNTRYSLRLRGGQVDFTQPYFLAPRLSFFASAGVWDTQETIYNSQSRGGRLGVIWRQQAGRRGELEPIDQSVRLSYSNDGLSYQVTPETLADITFHEQLIALGLDPVLGRGSGRLAAISIEGTRQSIDHRLDPHRGYMVNARLVHASPWLQGNFRYDEVDTEGRFYLGLGDGPVWASRARIAALLARNDASVPFSERYFLGGSASLRGWGRYQVAPLTTEGLPIGGRALVDLSTELRFAIRSSFGMVVFVDAGRVFADSDSFGKSPLLIAAGPGLRYVSPVGIIRADLGIQLKHVPGLVINGSPETRHWRIHFSIGHTF